MISSEFRCKNVVASDSIDPEAAISVDGPSTLSKLFSAGGGDELAAVEIPVVGVSFSPATLLANASGLLGVDLGAELGVGLAGGSDVFKDNRA